MRARRPRPFKHYGETVAWIEADIDGPVIEIARNGFSDPDSLRRLAAWLERAAKWVEEGE